MRFIFPFFSSFFRPFSLAHAGEQTGQLLLGGFRSAQGPKSRPTRSTVRAAAVSSRAAYNARVDRRGGWKERKNDRPVKCTRFEASKKAGVRRETPGRGARVLTTGGPDNKRTRRKRLRPYDIAKVVESSWRR